MLATKTFLYEILIRFDADGYRGSHVIDLQQVTDDGEILASKPLDPRPVEPAEVREILGDNAARMIQSTDRVIAELFEVRADRDTLIAQRDDANRARASAEADLAEARAEITRLNDSLAEATAGPTDGEAG